MIVGLSVSFGILLVFAMIFLYLISLMKQQVIEDSKNKENQRIDTENLEEEQFVKQEESKETP